MDLLEYIMKFKNKKKVFKFNFNLSMKKFFMSFVLAAISVVGLGQTWTIRDINEDALTDTPRHTEYIYTSNIVTFSFTSLNDSDFVIQLESPILFEEDEGTLGGKVSTILIGFYDENNNLIKKWPTFLNNNIDVGSPNILTGLNEKNKIHLRKYWYNESVGNYTSFQLAVDKSLKEKKLKEEAIAEELYKLSEPVISLFINRQKEINNYLLNNKGYIRMIIGTYGDGKIDVPIKCIN